jgi:hypothetical protein
MASLHYLRRIVPAALLGAAATFGGSAVAEPVVACAAPQEWDIGAYDACIKKAEDLFLRGEIENLSDAERECCEKTGGVWSPHGAAGKCVAPPATPAGSLPDAAPGTAPGVLTQNPPPPPPVRNPGVAPRPGVIETFTPAPIG